MARSTRSARSAWSSTSGPPGCPGTAGRLFGLLRPGGRLLNHGIASPGEAVFRPNPFVARYVEFTERVERLPVTFPGRGVSRGPAEVGGRPLGRTGDGRART